MTNSSDKPERIVVVDQSDPNRGQFDRSRVGKFNPDDTELRPEISPEDIAATKAELRRRMTRRSA